MKQTKMKIIETSDLGLAAALNCTGHRMVDTKMEDDSRVIFYFQEDIDIEQDCKKYFISDLKVDAAQYNYELRRLRKLVGAHYKANLGEAVVSKRTRKFEAEEEEEKDIEPKSSYRIGKDGYKKI
jgi:hypothetical protein